MPFLAGVKEGKLRTCVEPGAVLDIEATLEHDGSGFAVTRAKIESADQAICNANLIFRTMPFPKPDFAVMIRERAREIGLEDERV